jgi:hypothetical protein
MHSEIVHVAWASPKKFTTRIMNITTTYHGLQIG